MRKATQARLPDEGNDAQLLARLAAGDHVAFEALMRRHNQRLFRVARALLRDDQEAEDAVQEAYLSAYRHAASFRGHALVSTWLSRIVVNGCLMRLRQRRSHPVLVPFPPGAIEEAPAVDGPTPEESEPQYRDVLRAEVRRLLDRRIDELPPIFRAVFVMREVEDMASRATGATASSPRCLRAWPLVMSGPTPATNPPDGRFLWLPTSLSRVPRACRRPVHRACPALSGSTESSRGSRSTPPGPIVHR